MKSISVVFSLLLVLFAVSVQTQTQAPTPPPEMKALEVFIGDWTYEGEEKESPMGPAGKFSGKVTVRWVLNGFFQESKFVGKDDFGDIEIIEYGWYDSATKSYPYQGFQSNGDSYSGSMMSSIENISKYTVVVIRNGVQYKIKGTNTVSNDGMSWTWKEELVSTDNKSWTSENYCKFTKIKTEK